VFGYCALFASQLSIELTGRRFQYIGIIIGVPIGGVVAIFGYILIALLCILLPPIGLFFFLIKFAFVLKRRCKYEKKWEYYPRTVVYVKFS
jgi:hypothetical protein